jgi:beta-glucosidase
MGYERTDIGWPVFPEGFYKVLTYITDRYGQVPIYITENGSCYNDEPVAGRVRDERRIKYLKQHLTALSRSIESGVNIKGYLIMVIDG